MYPFKERKLEDGTKERVFSDEVDDDELCWHRDREDRVVTVLETNGSWQFQPDNELPYHIKEGDVINIKKLEWHRIIKGSGILKVSIKEY